MTTMKAWQVRAWGEPEEMTLADAGIPEPGPGEVRIANRAAALNFFDILQIQGKYQYKPPFPFTPGAETAGTVDAVGAGVSDLAPGDRVLAMPQAGAFAQYSLAPAGKVFPIPAGMDFPEAAAMPVVYHTSYFALTKRAALEKGEWLLVHAGASGVGMAAIQIGKSMGARVIATAGSEAKLAFCREQGAEHLIDYRDGGWVDRVKEITGGRGAGVIYDPVGGDIFDLSTRCIAPEGRLLVVGFAGGRIPAIQANRILLKDISIVGVHWGQYAREHPEYPAQAQQALEQMYAAGRIRPAVGARYPFEDVTIGLRDLAERKVMGKAVLTIEAHSR
ncbi:MAG TPA: NADPH:quinone oxidoreductase family protein [Bryobacteraceae bacterium]|nr:NADPH:quinone oxidoreductase family protein [Bryobacteraceae bacterium]